MTSTNELVPGDIVVVMNRAGFWLGGYRYIGPDPKAPGRLLVCERFGAHRAYTVSAEWVSRPAVKGFCPDDESPQVPASPGGHGDGRESLITGAQRRCLFAQARSVGMDIDDLRACTPRGSISALTQAEASALIGRLSDRSGHPESGGADEDAATPKQRGMIAYLRDLIGFSDAQFSKWLAKRFKVSSIAEISDKAHASRVIGGLLCMQAKRSAAAERDRREHGSTRAGTGTGG